MTGALAYHGPVARAGNGGKARRSLREAARRVPGARRAYASAYELGREAVAAVHAARVAVAYRTNSAARRFPWQTVTEHVPSADGARSLTDLARSLEADGVACVQADG